MTPMRSAMLAIAVAVLALASAASATQQAGSGTATITGSGTSWSLTITNTGTEAIKCWRYTLPPGIQATGIRTPPSGWQVGGNKPPPAPILGGRSDIGIPPNGKATFGFTTTRPFDTGRRLASAAADPPGTTAGSTDCVTDFTIPTDYGSSPPPSPKPKPCRCNRLTAQLFASSGAIGSNEAGLSGEIELRWTMRCTGGAGKCKGTLVPAPSRASKASGLRVSIGGDLAGEKRVTCTGTCRKLSRGTEELLLGSESPVFRERNVGKGDGRTITIEIDRFCNGEKAPLVFDLVLKPGTGELDRGRSDLNGNGIPDGRTRK